MAYKVIRRMLPERQVIYNQDFNDLNEALNEAKLEISHPYEIEVKVYDSFDNVKHQAQMGGR